MYRSKLNRWRGGFGQKKLCLTEMPLLCFIALFRGANNNCFLFYSYQDCSYDFSRISLFWKVVVLCLMHWRFTIKSYLSFIKITTFACIFSFITYPGCHIHLYFCYFILKQVIGLLIRIPLCHGFPFIKFFCKYWLRSRVLTSLMVLNTL